MFLRRNVFWLLVILGSGNVGAHLRKTLVMEVVQHKSSCYLFLNRLTMRFESLILLFLSLVSIGFASEGNALRGTEVDPLKEAPEAKEGYVLGLLASRIP